MTTLASIYNSASADELVKISNADTTAGFLEDKLVAGSNITLTKNNSGSNETFTIAASLANNRTGFGNFYLNTVSGNDSNTGLNSSSPVKTWDRLMEVLASQNFIQAGINISGTLTTPLDCSGASGYGYLGLSNYTNNPANPYFNITCVGDDYGRVFTNLQSSVALTSVNLNITDKAAFMGPIQNYTNVPINNTETKVEFVITYANFNMTSTTTNFKFMYCNVNLTQVNFNYNPTNPNNQVISIQFCPLVNLDLLTLSESRTSNYFAVLEGFNNTTLNFPTNPNLALTVHKKWASQKVYAPSGGLVSVVDSSGLVEI